MDILEQEDIVKGLPDQTLFQRADAPSGDIPPFLILSEIQRRTDMRKRFEASQPQPQSSVSDQIIMEGLGAAMAPQNSLPPPAMPAPPSTSVSHLEGSSPLMGQGMAAGGILGFNPGGVFPGQEPFAVSNEGLTGPGSAIRSGLESTFGYTAPGARNSEYYENKERTDALMRRVQEIENSLMGTIRNKRERRKEAFRLAREEAANEDSISVADSGEIDTAWDFQEGEVITPQGEVDLGRSLVEDPSLLDSSVQEDGFSLASVLNKIPPAATAMNFSTTGADTASGGSGNPTEERASTNVVGTNSDVSNLFSSLNKNQSPESTASADDYLASLEQLRQGTLDRLDTRRSESQDLINQIREEGRIDALSSALVQLGAGIAGGDMSAGLRDAGSAMTSANALARDAARAEQRGMRDYEEVALVGIDQSRVDENRFQYDQALAQDALNREQYNTDREYGLSAMTAEQSTLLKIAELDQDSQQFLATNELGRDKLQATLDDIERQYTKEEGIDTRAAVTTFIDHMEQVAEFLEDEGMRMSVEDKQKYLQAERAKILGALQGRIPDAFNVFRAALESEATTTGRAEDFFEED